METFEKKSVFITGANRGIGLATVHAFSKEGYDIIAHSRCETHSVNRVYREIEDQYNVSVTNVYFDLNDLSEINIKLRNFLSTKPRIDILVNNAGVIHGGLFLMTPMEEIQKVFNINFFGTLAVTQLIGKYMLRKKRGAIINVGSVAGEDLASGNVAYGISKSCIISLTKLLAKELGAYGIKVNCVSPSLTNTDMALTKEASKEYKEILDSKGAFQRLVEPEEVAQVIKFLASWDARFINGQVLRVDGGNIFN